MCRDKNKPITWEYCLITLEVVRGFISAQDKNGKGIITVTILILFHDRPSSGSSHITGRKVEQRKLKLIPPPV